MKKIILLVAAMAAMLSHAENKSYITRVFDYMPAPGQFVNTIPAYSPGEPQSVVLERALKLLGPKIEVIPLYDDDDNQIGEYTRVNPVSGDYITLGSYGGYVIFGFDHPVVNVEGEYDLQIFGNAFGSDSVSVSGGSSEPGIVMVGVDVDGDGVPSAGDKWYELAGSEYANPKTQKNFTITYYRPDENKPRVPDPNDVYLNDVEYVRWTCNSTDSLTEGYVYRNTFHNQSYWPQWAEGETLTFEGTKLPRNAVNIGQNGTNYYVQYFYDWGYVDNREDYDWNGNYDQAVHDKMNLGFKLDWAVDADGRPAKLKKVDFIKVSCGILQYCGWLGETSTEVKGAIDLHPDAPLPEEPQVRGDVNGDGHVDVADINAIINVVLGRSDLPADITGEGHVDVADVNAVINIILGGQ